MPKLIHFLESIDKSKTKKTVVFLVGMTLVLLFHFTWVRQLNKQYEIIVDDYSWVYQIDGIAQEKDKLVLYGWGFQLNQNAEKGNFDVILYDKENEKAYFPRMHYEQREDVNTYFLCEYDYTNSGFYADISLKKLDIENGTYEILLRPDGGKRSYSTGIYYSAGEIMYVDPAVYQPLEVQGTDLEQIVENGVLRVYRSDYGMYVYQYEGELYWIAEEIYRFVEDDTYIQFQMNTTQKDKLPEERLKNNWFWSNLGFNFKTYELSEWDTGKYRVAKAALPKEYSITYIWTGNYIDEWIWQQNFRPWYEFD